ncbi:MAG: hypothetical protein ACI4LP_05310 [Anaerovoracaceae bacterium]
MKAYFSTGNFNNQEEYNTYVALPEEEKAEDDFIVDLDKLVIGYGNIVLFGTDGKTQVIPRKSYYYAMSVAVNDIALVTHGPGFKSCTIVADENAENGFTFSYNSGVSYDEFLEDIGSYVGHVVEFLVKRKQDGYICRTQRFVWDNREFGPLQPDALLEVLNVEKVR